MHVKESGVLYDVYVKNDTYYQKELSLSKGENTQIDTDFNDYLNAIKESIPELAGLSDGSVSVYVLPESASDKTSSATEDVSDDIIGMMSTRFSFEGDETESMGVSTFNNVISNYQTNQSEAKSLLAKLKTVYEKDTSLSKTVERYSDTSNLIRDYTTKSTDADGSSIFTLSAVDNPLGYAIASIAGEATGNTIEKAMDAYVEANSSMADKLKKWAEEKKKEGENTLMETNQET